MITVTLIGLLVALGLPSFTAWIRNSQVRTVADALQTGIRTAQAEAVRRNRPVVLSFTNATPNPSTAVTAVAGGTRWALQTLPRVGETGASALTLEERYVGSGKLTDVAAGVAIASTVPDNTVKAICFNSSGRMMTNAAAECVAAATTFAISQTSADRNLNVLVALGGQMRMCDPLRPALSASSPDGCPP